MVDGLSEDDTVAKTRGFADLILSDEGNGVAWARHLGAEAASAPYVAFIDADIELPEGALVAMLHELQAQEADAIQAGLVSVHSNDYWSRALAAHHNRGRSRRWFGLVCTIFKRDVFRRFELDPSFKTGEDIEIRHRMQRAKAKAIVSRNVIVSHRFEPGFRFALNQFLMDGAGLGRMVRKFGWRSAGLLLMPAAGAVLGVARSLGRDPIYIPYYLIFMIFNYIGMAKGLLDRDVLPAKGIH